MRNQIDSLDCPERALRESYDHMPAALPYAMTASPALRCYQRTSVPSIRGVRMNLSALGSTSLVVHCSILSPRTNVLALAI